jgi:hypothetical protein
VNSDVLLPFRRVNALAATVAAQSSTIAILNASLIAANGSSTQVCSRPLCANGTMPSNGVCIPDCGTLRRRSIDCEPFCPAVSTAPSPASAAPTVVGTTASPTSYPTSSPSVSSMTSRTVSPTASPTIAQIASTAVDGGGSADSAFGIIIAVVVIILVILFVCGLVCYQRSHRASVKQSMPLPSATTNPTFSIQQPLCDPGSRVYEEIGPSEISHAVYEEPVMLAKYSASLPDASIASNVYDVPTNIESNAVDLDDNAYVAEAVSHEGVSAADNAVEPTKEEIISVDGSESSDARMSHLDKSSNMNDAVVRQCGSFSLTKPLRRSETRDVLHDDDDIDV